MNKTLLPAVKSGDLVLREIWKIKDNLSAACNHDVGQLFKQARKHQKASRKLIARARRKHEVSQF